MATDNVNAAEGVVAYRLMRIEEAQERTTEALEKFRDELKGLATKSEVTALETRLRQVENRLNRGWITPSMIGASAAGLITVLAQVWHK